MQRRKKCPPGTQWNGSYCGPYYGSEGWCSPWPRCQGYTDPAPNTTLSEQYCSPWPKCKGYHDPIQDQVMGSPFDGLEGRSCQTDFQCPKGRCQKAHWADTYGHCVGHGGGTRRRGGRVARYHEGGAVQGPNGQWMYVLPHDHPHSLPGNQYHPHQNIPRRPRRLKKPGISPLPPGMPPPRIPDIYRRGGTPSWNDGYGHTPMPTYSRGGRVGPGVGVCNGPSTAIDEFGNNIC